MGAGISEEMWITPCGLVKDFEKKDKREIKKRKKRSEFMEKSLVVQIILDFKVYGYKYLTLDSSSENETDLGRIVLPAC